MSALPPISSTRRNLRYCTIDGICATPWALLSLPGSFLMAALLNNFFAVGPFWFGIILAMPALANALSILLIPLVARFMKVRDMTLSLSWLNAGLWLSGIVAIAFLPAHAPKTAGLFFAILYGLSAMSGSLLVVGWIAWLGDFVPEDIRGRYMGQRNRYTNLMTLGFMGLSVALLNYMDASRAAYLILAGLAVLARLASISVQHLIVSPDPTGGVVASANWARELGGLRKETALLRFIAFGVIAGFGMAFLGTLAPLYAFNQLMVTPAEFTAFSIVATIAGTLCVRLWGRVIDRHGATPVLIITFIAWRIGDFGWVAVTPETKHALFLIWAWGGTMATGYMLASFNLLLKLIPKQSRSAGISLHLTTTSIAATAAPILAGSFIGWAGASGLDLAWIYRAGITGGIVGSLLSVIVLVGLVEPKTTPQLNTIQGAMRTLRHLVASQGLAFVSNLNFIARRKRPRR